MIRAVLALVQWLDRKFPPLVVVTQENYDGVCDRLHRHEKANASLVVRLETAQEDIARMEQELIIHRASGLDLLAKYEELHKRISEIENSRPVLDRIEAIEARQAEIAKMLTTPKKTESELLREQFVRGELNRLPSRSTVEKAS